MLFSLHPLESTAIDHNVIFHVHTSKHAAASSVDFDNAQFDRFILTHILLVDDLECRLNRARDRYTHDYLL